MSKNTESSRALQFSKRWNKRSHKGRKTSSFPDCCNVQNCKHYRETTLTFTIAEWLLQLAFLLNRSTVQWRRSNLQSLPVVPQSSLALRPKQPEGGSATFAERMRIAPLPQKMYCLKAERSDGVTTRVTMPTTQSKSVCVRSNGTRYLVLLVLSSELKSLIWDTKWFATKLIVAGITGVATE